MVAKLDILQCRKKRRINACHSSLSLLPIVPLPGNAHKKIVQSKAFALSYISLAQEKFQLTARYDEAFVKGRKTPPPENNFALSQYTVFDSKWRGAAALPLPHHPGVSSWALT
jgi:hypothetical protein